MGSTTSVAGLRHCSGPHIRGHNLPEKNPYKPHPKIFNEEKDPWGRIQYSN